MTSTFLTTKTLGQTLANASEICIISATGATGNMGLTLSVVQSAGVNRLYRVSVPVNSSEFDMWRRLAPYDKTEAFPDQNQWAVDMMVQGLQSMDGIKTTYATLRLVRTKVGSPASTTTLTCKVIAYPSVGESIVVTNSTETTTDATNTGIFEGALVTQMGGLVGINTDSPSHILDVSGNVNTSSAYMIGGNTALTSSTLGPSVTGSSLTTVGTLSTLNVSGNVSLTGLGALSTTNVVFVTPSSGALTYGPLSLDVLTGNVNAANITGTLITAGQPYITSVGTLSSVAVTGNVAAGNVSGTSITGTNLFGTLQTAAQPNITSVGTLSSLNVTGNLSLNGSVWASSVIHGTTTPFLYTGPGTASTNGVSFFSQTQTSGTAFVTAGGTNNSVFTFSTAGTYMLQAEVEVGFPWMPEGDINTYYLVNGSTVTKFGNESHAPSNFSCTRPYLLTVNASDNVRFVIDSSSGNEYEVGLNSTRLTMLKLA